MTNPFARVETWVFDLDDTLYPATLRLGQRINDRITAYVMRELALSRAEADRLRERYFREHGITLSGLIAHHGVDPVHYLDDIHAIDLDALRPQPDLVAALERLPGRRIVHTNGSRAHAARVLARVGLTDLIDAVYAIEDKGLVPKPGAEAYARIIAADGYDPARAAMVEDKAENLRVPKDLGMATVWVAHEEGTPAPPYVDRRVTRLSAFLADPR
jgi:putative hydrolase of the HAD superfamily